MALVSVGLNFVVAGPSSSSSSTSGALWAVVGSNGTLARGQGVLYSNLTEDTTGQFTVTFNRSLSGCTLFANPGTTAMGTQPGGFANASLAPKSISQVNVSTSSPAGVPEDASFHLAALCPGVGPTITYSAVVAANGTLISGSPGTKASLLTPTAYGVVFTQNVRGCAYIAGLGESSSGTPPAGSATVAQEGANSNGVWVNTYNAAGTLTAGTFHLTVYC